MHIHFLKDQLQGELEMNNNLGATKKILGMDTVRVRDKRKLIVSRKLPKEGSWEVQHT